MSGKDRADNKTPDNIKLTRKQVQQNPGWKDLLYGELEEQVFRKSKKVLRSPEKSQVRVQQNIVTEELAGNNKNTGTIPKVKNTSGKVEQKNSTTKQKEIGNASLLNITFDEKNARYSDIGGYLAEQSLIIGTTKDRNFSTSQTQEKEDILINYEEDLEEIESFELQRYSNNGKEFLQTVKIEESNNSPGESYNTDIFRNITTREFIDPRQNIEQNRSIIEETDTSLNQNPNQDTQRAKLMNGQPPQNGEQQGNMAQPMKLNLRDVANFVPEYDGKNMSPSEYIQKLKQVRKLVDDIDEANLTNLLKVKMRGEAAEALAGNNIATIEGLITGIRTLYPIDDDIHELYAQVRRIIQRDGETVLQYTNRLQRLIMQIKELKKMEGVNQGERDRFNTELDRNAAVSYKKGLRADIKYELGNENTVQDISKAAIEIESDIKRRRIMSMSSTNNMYRDYEEKVERPQKVLMCQICRDYKHEALFCPSAACVYCKSADHFSNNCRNVMNKIKLICKFCSQPGHSISACRFNKRQDSHCQYCQEMGHDVGQCPYISDYETCWKCKETGHNPNVCINKAVSKVEKCEYCDNIGHTVQNCPDVVCTKCNKKGHTIKYCKMGEGRAFARICTICEDFGHGEAECEQAKILVAEYKAKQQLKCQMCEESGHTAKYCPKLTHTQPQSTKFNRNYNNEWQKKFCDYCKNTGHVVETCRKLETLKKRSQGNIQAVCKYCNITGHTIDSCSKIKLLESAVDEFCEICKNIGHKSETCFKNRNNPGNAKTLSGRNA